MTKAGTPQEVSWLKINDTRTLPPVILSEDKLVSDSNKKLVF